MSFIHTGSIEVRTVNGRPQFTGTSHNRPITDWTLPAAEQDVRALIPAQRTGIAYDTHLLAANGGETR